MAGHGRPRSGLRAPARRQPKRTRNLGLVRVALWHFVLSLSASLLFAATSFADELDLRLRVTWGGGEARAWRGSLVARDGQLFQPKCLGSEADVADEFVLERDTLRFIQPIPMTSDGFDVQVVGTDETILEFELVPADRPESKKTAKIKLADYVQAARISHQDPLDDRGNKLHVQRAPGDRLRVTFERDALIFSPEEVFALTVQPHELALAAGTAMRCLIQLMPVDSDDVLWKESYDVRVDDAGAIPVIGPVNVALPLDEGVYDVVISLQQKRFAENLVPGNLVPSKSLIQRKVQVIVLGDQPIPVEQAEWTVVEQIDPANPKWWERLNWLPQWKVLPGSLPRAPLGDQPLVSREFQGQQVHELGSYGWHAVPVPIEKVGEPHILEVEYPADSRQTLGIYIVEPNAAGQVRTFGVDSGMDVSGYPNSGNQKVGKHRLIFWPRTETPWLLLSNHRSDVPAMFGKIRVLAGPPRLPPMELSTPSGERLLAAYYEKPLFGENLGAGEAYDLSTNGSYKDWQTFYLGTLRLVEYLKHTGFNAAVVTVLCDGATLYPSEALRTTPKFDNGLLFQSGQDPIPKDVLEMMLRIFDREGLKLIPAIQYSVQLPALEEGLRDGQSDLGGIALVGFLPGDPKPKLGRANAFRGAASFYNPLDVRVQQAMRQVAAEVLDRCKEHPSFAGLAVQLSPNGYATLPDDSWCLDDATFDRFAKANRLVNPAGQDRLTHRLQLVSGDARAAWLKWRTAEMTKFYRDLNADVQRIDSSAKLLLSMTELAAGRLIQNALRPRLSGRADFADAMLRHGLDGAELAQDAQVMLLRPHRVTLSSNLVVSGAQLELDHNEIVDDYFRSAGHHGASIVHQAFLQQLRQFDAVSPFGPENTSTHFAAHISPSGENSRLHFVRSLARVDSPVILYGGSVLPLGQEESQSRFMRVFRELPAGPFKPIESTSVGETSAAVVRMLKQSGRTYVYAANSTGLAATVQIQIKMAAPAAVQGLDGRPAPVLARKNDLTTWTVDLEPYDLAAIVCSSDAIQVVDWNIQFNPESVAMLDGMVQELRVRVDHLNKFQAIQVIENADFEQPIQQNQIPGWTFARNPGVTVNLDGNRPFQGNQSLHFRVQGNKTVGWIRSRPFPSPRTGRISVQAWIRTRDATQQPPLRMSLDGNLGSGKPTYRWWSLGIDVDGRTFQPIGPGKDQVPAQWSASPFLIHAIDLPMTDGGEVSIGFDMLGPGEVWIDDVQISDVYFEPANEFKELRKNVFNAQFQLQSGKPGELAECQHFLQSYWPQFLMEFVAPPRLSRAVPPPSSPAEKSSKWPLPKIQLKPMFHKPDKVK